jgi:hypothetical protein
MLFQEVFLRELVRDGFEERLVVMLSASESEELDTIVIEINLGADQPVWPVAGDGVRVSKDGDLSHVGGAADKEDSSPEARLEIEFPARGKWTTCRSLADADRPALAQCREVLARSLPQLRHAGMFEALPDLRLPESVEALDGSLESRFVWGREDGGDTKAQAQANDAADRVGMLARAGEAIVVVELSELGKTERPPVLDQTFHGMGCRDGRAGPGGRQPAQQRSSRENRQVRAATNSQSFDGIEQIQFGFVSRHGGNVPSLWRRGSTHSVPTVQDPISHQNAADRSHRRTRRDTFGEPLASNSGRSDLPQYPPLQPPSQCENVCFPPSLRPLCLLRSRRAIVPIDAIEPLSLGTAPPMLHGRERYTPLPRGRSLRHPPSDRCHHFPPLSGSEVFQS